MKRRGVSLALAFALLCAAPAVAHHSVATFFLLDKTVEIKGIVKEFKLVNPHMRMVLEVTTPSGEKKTWTGDGWCHRGSARGRLVA